MEHASGGSAQASLAVQVSEDKVEHLLRQMQVATGTFTALLDVVRVHESRKLVRELQPLLLLSQQSSLVSTTLYVGGLIARWSAWGACLYASAKQADRNAGRHGPLLVQMQAQAVRMGSRIIQVWLCCSFAILIK